MKISVVVPAYNSEKFLRMCVDSILNQSYSNIELILVDDGSKDRTPEISDEYQQLDRRVCVIHKQNEGSAAARTDGIKLATGDYIFCVDSDDWIDLELLKLWNVILEKEHPDIIVSSYARYEGSEDITIHHESISDGIYKGNDIFDKIIPFMFCRNVNYEGGIAPSFGNKLIRADLLKQAVKIIDKNLSYGDDLVCTLPSITRAEKIVFDKGICGYYYRYNSTSITQSGDEKYVSKIEGLFETLDNCFDEKFEKILEDQILQYKIFMLLKIGKVNALRLRNSKLGKFMSLYKYYNHICNKEQFSVVLSNAKRRESLFSKRIYQIIELLTNQHILWATVKSSF